ncbi:MAG: hypothetical protein V2I33_16375 [Kangiellaceae bacterium]|jgi:hypothetical protein|nr:hypothetical protein [Kangiellaceae bacterium]
MYTNLAKEVYKRAKDEGNESAESFLEGYLACCEDFGIHKDGERYLGIGNVTVKEVKNEIDKLKDEIRSEYPPSFPGFGRS